MPKSNLVRDRTREKSTMLISNIQKYMCCRGRTAKDMARATGISIDTWYKKAKNPETFKFSEVVRIVNYLDFSDADRSELL